MGELKKNRGLYWVNFLIILQKVEKKVETKFRIYEFPKLLLGSYFQYLMTLWTDQDSASTPLWNIY